MDNLGFNTGDERVFLRRNNAQSARERKLVISLKVTPMLFWSLKESALKTSQNRPWNFHALGTST
jgi:hypothetical protein